MKSLPTQGILGAGAAVLAALLAAMAGALPLSIGLVTAAAMAGVAFAAQSRHLRDKERLVYRPVYVRRHDVQRRVMSGD